MPSFGFNTTRNAREGKRERLTVGASAVGITPTAYTIPSTEKVEQRAASAAVLQVMGQSIIWTIDGSTPSGSVGFEADPGDYIYLDSAQKVKSFKAVRSGGTNATLEVVALFGA